MKMIIPIVFILLSIVFVVSVKAQLAATTTAYDNDTKEFTFKDEHEAEMGKIKLLTSTNNKVIRGDEVLVFEIAINSSLLKSIRLPDIINKMDFYDIKKLPVSIPKSIKYKYREKVGENNVPNYNTTCKRIQLPNMTFGEQCTTKIIGYITVPIYRWKSVDTSISFKDSYVVIGGFTKVRAGDKVEWIPTLFERESKEWASWTEGLNKDLIAWYDFTNETDVYKGIYNLSSYSYARKDKSSLDSWDYNLTDRVQPHLTQSTLLDNANLNNLTISVWMNFTRQMDSGHGADGQYLFLKTNIASQDRLAANFEGNDGRLYFWGEGSNAGNWNCPTTITTNWTVGQWYHVVMEQTTSGIYVYVNGTLECTCTSAACKSPMRSGTEADMEIGSIAAIGAASRLGAWVDGWGFWNRTLSEAEIATLFDSGTGTFYSLPPDTTNPQVSVSIPTYAQVFTDGNAYFNLTVTDNVAPDSCEYRIGGTDVNPHSMTRDGDVFYDVNTSIADGVYQVFFSCNDTSDNINDTESQYFGIDTHPPSVTILSPTLVTYSVSEILLNISSTDGLMGSTLECNYSFNGGTTQVALTQDGTAEYFSELLNFTDGIYTVDFICIDYSGWVNSTESHSFIVDTVTPASTGGTSTKSCRYRKLGYYNLNLPWLREENCL